MIAIAIGHSRKINSRYDGGAYSQYLKKNERTLNLEVAEILKGFLEGAGQCCKIISDYAGNGYGAAMMDAARQIEDCGAKLAIELHFNAATPSANGHEWLHWHSSTKGKALAKAFHDQFLVDFPDIKPRGLVSLKYSSRGAQFVRLTHCPAILTEPFFGSNPIDCSQITAKRLAETYARAILNYVEAS